MKWQLLLLTLATLVSVAIGGTKWRARFLAADALEDAERAGKWVLVSPRSPGIELRTHARGVVEVPKPWRDVMSYESIDATPDLRRLTWIDGSRYDQPTIVVASADAPKAPLLTHEGAQGSQLACPTFDVDGGVLWYETAPYNTSGSGYARPVTRLLRLPSPGDGTASAMKPVPRELVLPVAIAPEDCFERSTDGTVIAWLGTDTQIHVVRREPSGAFVDLKTFLGTDFALSKDGSFLAVNEAGRLARIGISSGSRTIVGEANVPRIFALSPDDRWVLAQAVGVYNASTAWRLSDGAPVNMGTTPTSYSQNTRRHTWIAWTGEVLPEPVATPTPRPTRTPRRNPSPNP